MSSASSWNPFSRLGGSRDGPIASSSISDLARERDELLRMEKVCRKLGQELKKYQDSLNSLSVCEKSLADNLSNYNASDQALVSTSQTLRQNATENTEIDKQFSSDLRATCSESVKKYTESLQSWHSALRKWDVALQECNKMQAKVDKYQGKQTEPQAAAKLEQFTSGLDVSKKSFYQLHNSLLADLRKFNGFKTEYFEPNFETLLQLQRQSLATASKRCELEKNSIGADRIPDSDSAYKEQMQQKLNEIRALSIVAD